MDADIAMLEDGAIWVDRKVNGDELKTKVLKNMQELKYIFVSKI